MVYRKILVPVFVVVIAVAALSVSTVSMALTPISNRCDFVNGNGSLSAYSMVTDPDENGNWPVWNAAAAGWEWRYKLETRTSKYNYSLVDVLLPVCDPAIQFTDGAGLALTTYPPGSGDPTSSYRFGWWDGTKYTVRFPQNISTSPRLYSLLTKSVLPASNTYMGMKINNETYSCKNIAGPGCPDCPGLPFQPATINQCMQVEGHNVLLVRNANRCITEIWDCGNDESCAGGANPGGSCEKLEVNIQVDVVCKPGATCQEQAGTTIGDILGNQICPEGILFSASSPGCSNVRTLSGWVQVCR